MDYDLYRRWSDGGISVRLNLPPLAFIVTVESHANLASPAVIEDRLFLQ
jgi:hypothetical protein